MALGSKVKDAKGNVGTATNLSPSLVFRVAQGVKYVVAGVKPGDWFGPEQPIQPVAQEAAGRVLDYQVGYNLLQRLSSGNRSCRQLPRTSRSVRSLQHHAACDRDA